MASKILKNILKKIFPIIFLKNVFLIYNRFKIKTIYKLLYPEYKIQKSDFQVHVERNPFDQIDISNYHLDPQIYNELKKCWMCGWTQDEYIIQLNNKIIIEPNVGWGIADGNKLVYPSLGFSRAEYLKRPNLISILSRQKTKFLPQVISLRDTGEENYFHFFNDVISKILYLKAQNLFNENAYIVITESLFNKPYFQYFYRNTSFRDLNWYVQKQELISTEMVTFCKPFTHSKYLYDQLLNLIPVPEKKDDLMVFLTRSKTRLRHISNIEEVEELVKNFGFKVVDADNLNFEEQIELFYNTRRVIGVHGAGLTNIIFRRGQPLSVLEIFHTHHWIPFHYVLLSRMYNYQYDAILGINENIDSSGGFVVDIKALRKKIEKIVLT